MCILSLYIFKLCILFKILYVYINLAMYFNK